MNVMLTYNRWFTWYILLILIACKPQSTNVAYTEENLLTEVSASNEQITHQPVSVIDESSEPDKKQDILETKRIESKPPQSLPESRPKKTTKKKKPRKFAEISFDSVIHHLPAVKEGDKFKNEFFFTNTGEIPLTIKEASSSCGCTTPSYSFLDIAPGKQSSIAIDYYSVNKEGLQEAEVVIKANTNPSSTTLKMLFSVLPRDDKSKEKKDSLSN